jgi:hypothetical protein
MIKQTVGIIGFAVLLSSIMFFPFSNFVSNDEFELLQAKQDKIEILIISRGFTVGNPHYEPENVTAMVGTLIEWTNGDLVHHTVTNDEDIQGKLEGQIFHSGPIPPRSEFLLDTSRLLDDVYPYHCAIHPWARGTLTLITQPISVVTDKSLYNVGERVTVSGIASMPTPSTDSVDTLPKHLANSTTIKSVWLRVFTSENNPVLSQEVPTLSNGKYSYTFTIKGPDTYTVKAMVNSFSASTMFEVKELPKEKVTVTKIEFEDANGKVTNTAKVGQQIFVRAQIKNMLQVKQDYAYAVQIKDSSKVTVLLAWKNDSIGPFALSTSAVAWTPESEGMYSVEIFVWKDMIAPEPLTQVVKATLVVR